MEQPVYLRVDEIARRFGVSVDDVLAACSVLSFPAREASCLVEIDDFAAALHTIRPITAATQPRRRVAPLVAAAAAALVAIAAVTLVPRGASHTPTAPVAAYKAALRSSYASAVGRAPQPKDFATLAQEWRAITPPPALRSQHEELIVEAEAIAAATGDGASPAPTIADPTPAIDALREYMDNLDRAARP